MVFWLKKVSHLTAKNRPGAHATADLARPKLGFADALTGRLGLLVGFAVVYGLVFINYIDLITNGSSQGGYHLWLVFMYFLPFVGFSFLNVRNWQLTLGLGLTASLMNDVFYGLVGVFSGLLSVNLNWYYSNWLIPQGTALFHFNLGFGLIPVYSWMMAATIYLRIAVVAVLFYMWKRQAAKKAGTVSNRSI
jgi:hypothetical protein